MTVEFQSTPSRRGRLLGVAPRGTTSTFQSTPSRRGRLSVAIFHCLFFRVFQSTPSRRGRQVQQAEIHPRRLISIHALAKRATVEPLFSFFVAVISIHALAKRATRRGAKAWNNLTAFQSTPSRRGRRQFSINGTVIVGNFNPRPREEGDCCKNIAMQQAIGISIHALAKRATARIHLLRKEMIFQSTPSRRGRR